MFNGGPCDFQMFYDEFTSTIQNMPDLSIIKTFNYLKLYMTATAPNSIEGINLMNPKQHN